MYVGTRVWMQVSTGVCMPVEVAPRVFLHQATPGLSVNPEPLLLLG